MRFPFLLALVVIFSGILIACNEPDIRLINQIKTFGPKWSSMGEKLNFIDRNLGLMEDQFEANYSELEPIFGQIPDSLRGQRLKLLLTSYSDIVEIRDSLRGSYKDHKKEFTLSVEAFNTWEKKVMDGDVKPAVAYSDLTKFKQTYGKLDAEIEQMRGEMNFISEEHNRIFAGLSNYLEKPNNYRIRLK